jgi:hypothetical protein
MDIQRTMEFILEQQAANTADIGALKESTKRLEESTKRLEESTKRLEESTRALQQNAVQLHESVRSLATTSEHILDLHESHENVLTALADSQLKITDSHRLLAESQAATEDKLNALIDVVDRLFPKQ